MKFIIDEVVANKVLGYLARRPYAEVALLINDLQSLIPLADCKDNGTPSK